MSLIPTAAADNNRRHSSSQRLAPDPEMTVAQHKKAAEQGDARRVLGKADAILNEGDDDQIDWQMTISAPMTAGTLADLFAAYMERMDF